MASIRHLPPLQTLAAFEAAARLESFARAADELCVTHSAVSHRIRLLENHLGARLFLRLGKRVVLTPQGMSFLETVSRALELLRAGAASVARQSGRRLRVSTLPAFAHSWLVYRIERFLRAHPDIDLEIDTTPSVVDLKSGEADLAIRHGLGNWEGLEVIRFLDDELQAVCSPDFRNAHPEIKAPRDLKEAPLLRHTAQRWAPWFRAAGLDWPEPARGPAYSDSAVMLAAAAEGHGVALAKRLLATPAIESGRLVPLFPLSVKAQEAYHIVYVKSARDRPEVNAFVEWLLSEAEPSGNGANC